MSVEQLLARAEHVVSECNGKLQTARRAGWSDAAIIAVVTEGERELRAVCEDLRAEQRRGSRRRYRHLRYRIEDTIEDMEAYRRSLGAGTRVKTVAARLELEVARPRNSRAASGRTDRT